VTVTVAATCTACGACLATCPERALRRAPRRPAVIDVLCTDCLACLEVCPVDAIVPVPPVHPIEEASYRIMAERVDLSSWPAGDRDVVARMIHATADESFAGTARIGQRAVEAGVAALAGGAPVVCDARMVVAGIPSVAGAVCLLEEVPEAPPGDTRSAAAIRLAAERYPDGAVWVVGNAPTALFALLELHAAGGSGRPSGRLRRRGRVEGGAVGRRPPPCRHHEHRGPGREPGRRRGGQRPGPPRSGFITLDLNWTSSRSGKFLPAATFRL
jgi:precorrin isomerase